jgi:hypothetical protein
MGVRPGTHQPGTAYLGQFNESLDSDEDTQMLFDVYCLGQASMALGG